MSVNGKWVIKIILIQKMNKLRQQIIFVKWFLEYDFV